MKRATKKRNKYGRGTGKTDPIDKHVGKQIKVARLKIGMSMETMADELGIAFQQIQKYERGKNRVSCSKLYHISRILEQSISYFFPGEVDNTTIEEENRYRATTYVRRTHMDPEALKIIKGEE